VTDGSLFEFDLDLLKVYKRKPKQVAQTTDFYTIDTPDGPSDAVEQIIARIEDAAARVVHKLAAPGTPITAKELDALVLFVALQRHRVPAHRDQMIDFVDRAEEVSKRMAAARGLDPEESTAQLRKEMEFTRSRNFTNPFLLESLTPTFRLMRRRGWALMRRADDAPPFVISDSPVVITDLREDTGPPYFPLIPYGEDSKLTMPLSPDLVLVSYYEPEASTECYAPSEFVGLLNHQQMMNTVRRLFGRENDFTWGVLPDRTLWWKDYVLDQEEARAEQRWVPPHLR
jgi:hypothetical protein